MKIYTKTGDKGTTSLIGGTRVSKDDIRIEAYGTVDELNSWIGLLRDQKPGKEQEDVLLEVQDRLFSIGSNLASDPERSKMKIPHINEEDIQLLEKNIDRMNEELPEMKSFILPGGDQSQSFCHVARCVCRRAERNTIHLSGESFVDPLIIKYLNRLSDYLFVLARKIGKDRSAVETPWRARV